MRGLTMFFSDQRRRVQKYLDAPTKVPTDLLEWEPWRDIIDDAECIVTIRGQV